MPTNTVKGFNVNGATVQYDYESLSDRLLKSSIGDEYNSSSTYKVDEYVMYAGQLYRCIVEITSPQSFDSSKWEAVSVGDDLRYIKKYFCINDGIKSALLNLLSHVAYTDEHGQDYYDELEAELFRTADLVSIYAVFNQGQNVIYDTDSLDTLKQYLVVTATYDDSSTATVTGYTLGGTLTEGTSTITVSYGGKTTTFNVTVTSYWGTTWEFADGNPTDNGFNVGVGSGASAGMGSSYYYLTSSSSSGASISGDPNFTGTSGVYEIEFMFPALPNSSFYYGGPGVRFVFTGNKIQMYQTPYDSSLTDVYTGVQANTWYKARLEFAPNTIPILTLNDTVIEPSFLCGWDGARFLMGISKNTGSVYIKSIKIREEA